MFGRFRWTAAAVLVVALAGCTERGSPSAPVTTSPSSPVLSASTPASPSPAPAGSSAGSTPPAPAGQSTAPGAGQSTAPGARLDGIQLVRSGGIAGITETTTIRPDGTWTRVTSKGVKAEGKVDQAKLTQLARLSGDPRLRTEAARKPVRGNCADTYAYMLIVGSQKIRYEQCPGSGDKPMATIALIGLVQDAAK